MWARPPCLQSDAWREAALHRKLAPAAASCQISCSPTGERRPRGVLLTWRPGDTEVGPLTAAAHLSSTHKLFPPPTPGLWTCGGAAGLSGKAETARLFPTRLWEPRHRLFVLLGCHVTTRLWCFHLWEFRSGVLFCCCRCCCFLKNLCKKTKITSTAS